jgi:transposase
MIPPTPPLAPDEILAVYAQGPAAVLRLVSQLHDQLAGQQQTIAALSAQLQGLTAQATTQQRTIADLAAQLSALQQRRERNSQNSPQPPSRDGPARPPRPTRTRSGRHPGGQPGHPGHALRFSAHPDRVVVHRPARCRVCGQDLAAAPARVLERHQVIDRPPLTLETVEHQTVCCTCPACGTTSPGAFPPDADKQLGYGPRLSALGVYLTGYQLLPYGRASAVLRDLCGAGPGPGTLYQAAQTAAGRLAAAEAQVRTRLRAAAVAHFDETGINIGGQRAWLHGASTREGTLYSTHRRRGKVGLDALGVLADFTGTAVQDSYASYRRYRCAHARCNAHLLRELPAVREAGGQGWARQLPGLLGRLKRAAARARAAGASAVPEAIAGG